MATSAATNNTAIGASALRNNTEGYSNTATGVNALLLNRVGQYNTATGLASLLNNTGSNNTAVGYSALLYNTTGENNIAIGYEAGINLTTGNNNIDIGSLGQSGESNTIRIGKRVHTATYISGINGATVAGGIGVLIDGNGRLGTNISSERFKEEIQPMDNASEAILSLQPVTFRYKHELDPIGIPQFGLVAEQVEKVNPDLVARDDEGRPYSVRYEAVNAMLLNEFLKEHRQVVEQGDEIAELKTTVAQLKSALKEQAAAIREVSEQMKADKATLTVASVNR